VKSKTPPKLSMIFRKTATRFSGSCSSISKLASDPRIPICAAHHCASELRFRSPAAQEGVIPRARLRAVRRYRRYRRGVRRRSS
jgi:hypothetical protein